WGLWWDDASRPVNLCRYPEVYGGILPYEVLPFVYSSARIVLGLNCHAGSATQTSMRPYEALACGGGIYLSPYTVAQEALFGDAIFQVRDTEETMAAVETILGFSEEQRRERALRAQEEVYAKHDYRRRAEQIVAAFRNL
ncbi:MAG: glycosyltransferase, partial [Bacteroidota bacterium]